MDINVKYYVGNLLVYVKALNDELNKKQTDLGIANQYGKKIDANLNKLAEILKVESTEAAKPRK